MNSIDAFKSYLSIIFKTVFTLCGKNVADMRNKFKFIQYAHGKLVQLKDAFQSSIQCWTRLHWFLSKYEPARNMNL